MATRKKGPVIDEIECVYDYTNASGGQAVTL